jgi:hypothetical protein
LLYGFPGSLVAQKMLGPVLEKSLANVGPAVKARAMAAPRILNFIVHFLSSQPNIIRPSVALR